MVGREATGRQPQNPEADASMYRDGNMKVRRDPTPAEDKVWGVPANMYKDVCGRGLGQLGIESKNA